MSGFGVQISENRLEIRLVGLLDRIENPQPLLTEIAMMERDEAVQRIKDGGHPPWPPSKKTLGGDVTARSHGTLFGSTKANAIEYAPGDIFTRGGYGQTGVDEGTMLRAMESAEAIEPDGPLSVSLGINVRTADGKYNYAKIFQEGSGVYAGHSEWTIAPKAGGVLSWSIGGVRFFASSVTMQGQPPRPFIFVEGTEEKIVAIGREWLRMPLEDAS